jgi:lysyl-tRNA synthetase class 2
MRPEKKAVEMSEDEKTIFHILKANSPMLLNDLKTQSGFSNKKWDKTIKDLTKKSLAKINNTEEGLFVELGK